MSTSLLSRLATAALELLMPDEHTCVNCGEGWFDMVEHGLCPECTRLLCNLYEYRHMLGIIRPFMPPAALGKLDYADALYLYNQASAKQIWALKYHGRSRLGMELGRTMQPMLERLPVKIDMVLPVPLHYARLRERGYNQSECLCNGLCEGSIPVYNNVLTRTRYTNTQTQLSHELRAANVEGAFSVVGDIAGAHILIVDDVLTTGSTAAECAQALRRAGAAWVGAFAYASPVHV